ncbi:unnamed protein product [Dracunculus medinensis]|uniref:A-kinase anchor protein 17A n=1 Tax=Dracunculus medinensis TaxID=318479 RepID=A0A0N4U0M8_DRAME|nr:unnamed protein product [Dracunculus medinensis]
MSHETPSGWDDLEPFCQSYGLYLKPFARLNISICLPKLKQPGQSISNWDLMEKIRKAIKPIELISIKVTTSTLDLVRFEAESPSRKALSKVIKSLDGYSLKVFGFIEALKVRAGEAKSNFPTRYDWDEFFRNAKGMDELKPGERPDTIYLAKLPVHWFKKKQTDDLPSEDILKKIFQQFGSVRCVDIPICDPYRKKMSPSISGIRNSGFTFGEEVLFEAYIQFSEYISFVRAMDGLRNMKLVKRMDDDNLFETSIQVGMVDFDKSRHLSDESIRERAVEREKLIKLERDRLFELQKKEQEENARKLAEEQMREKRRLEREEKRRLKRQEEKRLMEERRMQEIAFEQRKLLEQKRCMESKRLLVDLGRRIQARLIERRKNEVCKIVQKGTCETDHHETNVEADLRQSLLQEQEIRLRKRIEAKMMLRLEKGSRQRNGSALEENYENQKKLRRQE